MEATVISAEEVEIKRLENEKNDLYDRIKDVSLAYSRLKAKLNFLESQLIVVDNRLVALVQGQLLLEESQK